MNNHLYDRNERVRREEVRRLRVADNQQNLERLTNVREYKLNQWKERHEERVKEIIEEKNRGQSAREGTRIVASQVKEDLITKLQLAQSGKIDVEELMDELEREDMLMKERIRRRMAERSKLALRLKEEEEERQARRRGKVERKVITYKERKDQKLLDLLNKEQEKEAERINLEQGVKDPVERHRLSKILAYERSQAQSRIDNLINKNVNDVESFSKKKGF